MKRFTLKVTEVNDIDVLADSIEEAIDFIRNGVKSEDGEKGMESVTGEVFAIDYQVEIQELDDDIEEDQTDSILDEAIRIIGGIQAKARSNDPKILFYALIDDSKVIKILNKYGTVNPEDRFIDFSGDVTYKDVEIVKANFKNVSKAAKVVYGTELIGVRVCECDE